MTKKIVRIPKVDNIHKLHMEIHNWVYDYFRGTDGTSILKCELLYRHIAWSDGKWHTGSKEEIAAVDFENKDDAIAFAMWLGLEIL